MTESLHAQFTRLVEQVRADQAWQAESEYYQPPMAGIHETINEHIESLHESLSCEARAIAQTLIQDHGSIDRLDLPAYERLLARYELARECRYLGVRWGYECPCRELA